MPKKTNRPAAPLARPGEAHPTALLITDMISSWDFPDAGPLLRHAAPIATAIAQLKKRCRAAGVPVIYANDNHGQWRSDFRRVVQASLEHAGAGARITRILEPGDDDYFVLKPKHSAFFATPLEILLDHLQSRRLVIAGVSSDQCVLNSAADARMREYEVVVPGDCVATQSSARNREALAYFSRVMGIRTTLGRSIRLDRAAAGNA